MKIFLPSRTLKNLRNMSWILKIFSRAFKLAAISRCNYPIPLYSRVIACKIYAEFVVCFYCSHLIIFYLQYVCTSCVCLWTCVCM